MFACAQIAHLTSFFSEWGGGRGWELEDFESTLKQEKSHAQEALYHVFRFEWKKISALFISGEKIIA